MGHALLEADDELEDDAIAAREQRLRDLREQQAARDAREARLRALEADLDDCALEADLDARETRLRALEADLDELDLEAVRQRSEAIAAGMHGRASAAASGSAAPPNSGAEDERNEHSRGQVEPSFDSSKVTSVELVANDLLPAHGKDAVIMIINRLREASALNITVTELRNIGGEDLVNTLVQIATEFGVEPPELSEMIAQVIRDEAFESRAREPPAEPSRAEEGYIEST